jgi:hypothetical protein
MRNLLVSAGDMGGLGGTMRKYCSTARVALPLLCLICLIQYINSVNIIAAVAAVKSGPSLGNTESGFMSSLLAYPHEAFRIVGGLANDRSDGRSGPSSPRI